MIRIPDYASQDHDHGMGDFRTPNLVAILHAVPQTDGTCGAVPSKAREYESTVTESTLDEWIQEGREDLIAGDTETAFATVRHGLTTTVTTLAKRQCRRLEKHPDRGPARDTVHSYTRATESGRNGVQPSNQTGAPQAWLSVRLRAS